MFLDRFSHFYSLPLHLVLNTDTLIITLFLKSNLAHIAMGQQVN